MTGKQMIAECLRNGPRYTKSFQTFKKTMDAMLEAGELHRVAPERNCARNMVELTGRGWRVYFGEDLLVSRLDRFAELLAQGFEPRIIGEELNLTKGQVSRCLMDIKRQLGAQAV